jgi:hypothetical protein
MASSGLSELESWYDDHAIHLDNISGVELEYVLRFLHEEHRLVHKLDVMPSLPAEVEATLQGIVGDSDGLDHHTQTNSSSSIYDSGGRITSRVASPVELPLSVVASASVSAVGSSSSSDDEDEDEGEIILSPTDFMPTNSSLSSQRALADSSGPYIPDQTEIDKEREKYQDIEETNIPPPQAIGQEDPSNDDSIAMLDDHADRSRKFPGTSWLPLLPIEILVNLLIVADYLLIPSFTRVLCSEIMHRVTVLQTVERDYFSELPLHLRHALLHFDCTDAILRFHANLLQPHDGHSSHGDHDAHKSSRPVLSEDGSAKDEEEIEIHQPIRCHECLQCLWYNYRLSLLNATFDHFCGVQFGFSLGGTVAWLGNMFEDSSSYLPHCLRDVKHDVQTILNARAMRHEEEDEEIVFDSIRQGELSPQQVDEWRTYWTAAHLGYMQSDSPQSNLVGTVGFRASLSWVWDLLSLLHSMKDGQVPSIRYRYPAIAAWYFLGASDAELAGRMQELQDSCLNALPLFQHVQELIFSSAIHLSISTFVLFLTNMICLTELRLAGIQQISTEEWETVTNWPPNLVWLCLRATKIGAATLRGLYSCCASSLLMLDISECLRLTDAGTAVIPEFSSLKYLSIFGCYRLTNEAVINLAVVRSMLAHISMSGCYKITYDGQRFLTSQLPELRIWNNVDDMCAHAQQNLQGAL